MKTRTVLIILIVVIVVFATTIPIFEKPIMFEKHDNNLMESGGGKCTLIAMIIQRWRIRMDKENQAILRKELES